MTDNFVKKKIREEENCPFLLVTSDSEARWGLKLFKARWKGTECTITESLLKEFSQVDNFSGLWRNKSYLES